MARNPSNKPACFPPKPREMEWGLMSSLQEKLHFIQNPDSFCLLRTVAIMYHHKYSIYSTYILFLNNTISSQIWVRVRVRARVRLRVSVRVAGIFPGAAKSDTGRSRWAATRRRYYPTFSLAISGLRHFHFKDDSIYKFCLLGFFPAHPPFTCL